MRKLTKISAVALAAMMAFASCKKDDKDKGPQAPTYATQEEGKGMLQTAAIDYAQTMAGLTDGDFFTASMNLANLMMMNEEMEPVSVEEELLSGSFLKSNVLGLPLGTYTWGDEGFAYVEGTESIKVLFPYSEESTGNDCELTLSYDASANEKPEETLPLPVFLKNVNSTMKVKGAEVFNLKGDITYSKNGEPTLSKGAVTVEGFQYAVEETKNDGAIGFKSSWKKGSQILSATEISMKGKFNYDELMAIIAETQENAEGVSSEELIMALISKDLLNNATFAYQMMDVKSSVEIDLTSLLQGFSEILSQLASEEEIPEEMFKDLNEQVIAIVNNNMKAKVLNTKTNNVIANIFVDLDKGAILTFGEGVSPVAAEVYFKNGFEELLSTVEDIVTSIQGKIEGDEK